MAWNINNNWQHHITVIALECFVNDAISHSIVHAYQKVFLSMRDYCVKVLHPKLEQPFTKGPYYINFCQYVLKHLAVSFFILFFVS